MDLEKGHVRTQQEVITNEERVFIRHPICRPLGLPNLQNCKGEEKRDKMNKKKAMFAHIVSHCFHIFISYNSQPTMKHEEDIICPIFRLNFVYKATSNCRAAFESKST
ncbi:uncharacterized protein LOC118150508 [Callithrix jacchus]|uniref:uncharacterized protein LOC118150508 n=1 Tax=Callithrix jacchus TaxID=9483 RepID=UPI00159EC025|nr:uncharacterized protein LOC118150508 [Callithrix jacchus]